MTVLSTPNARCQPCAPDREPGYVDDRAGCAFGLATRRGLDDLGKDFDRLEAKVNGLLFGVGATLLVEIWRGWR
jgi:hypothetical protein